VFGQISNSANSQTAVAVLKFGTGTPPVNGAAATGTSVVQQSVSNNGSSGGLFFPVSMSAIIPTLTPGTTYWLDLDVLSLSAGTSTVLNITATAFEL
jgi:hypothetical protein